MSATFSQMVEGEKRYSVHLEFIFVHDVQWESYDFFHMHRIQDQRSLLNNPSFPTKLKHRLCHVLYSPNSISGISIFVPCHLLSISKPISYQCELIVYFNMLVDKIAQLFYIIFHIYITWMFIYTHMYISIIYMSYICTYTGTLFICIQTNVYGSACAEGPNE